MRRSHFPRTTQISEIGNQPEEPALDDRAALGRTTAQEWRSRRPFATLPSTSKKIAPLAKGFKLIDSPTFMPKQRGRDQKSLWNRSRLMLNNKKAESRHRPASARRFAI
jgi:hypothetical protein